MKKLFISVAILFLAGACSRQPAVVQPVPTASQPSQTQPATTTPVQATTTSIALPIKYDNTQYGFVFSLPVDWSGFSTYATAWSGNPLAGSELKGAIGGPTISIRNPKWTEKNHYEDIPVMIFTLDQWSQIQAEKLSVSAAPFPPSELGRNTKYVFALPPRYDYDFSTGYEQVEQIIQSKPLQAY